MKYILSATIILCAVAGSATAEYADYTYVSPAKAANPGGALPADVLAAALAQPVAPLVYGDFAGRNDALKAAYERSVPAIVADGMPLNLDGAGLFQEVGMDGDARILAAAVTSVDAFAVRLLADLGGLADGETLYVVDPVAPYALGPYTAADAAAGGRWLPTVFGDTAVLLVISGVDSEPAVPLLALSHFFVDPAEKAYACPVQANCVTDTVYQEVSSGVGLLIVPYSEYSQAQCSGALLNNPDTAELEGYFITANHCFPSSVDSSAIEVIWDYRTACDGSGVPDLDTLPRSEGAEILAVSDYYDGEFLELETVPVGTYGRAWLGWDTRDPVEGEAIAGAHYPQGNPLKACFGKVTSTDVDTSLGQDQIGVLWDQGVTEQGSSGSPLMYADTNYRVLGMLSNGPVHDCGNPSQNRDNFSSFRAFYPQIGCYLLADGECVEGPCCAGLCPAKAAFSDQPEVLASLRAFRDQVLAKSGPGQLVISAYYAVAPYTGALVQQSPEVRAWFVASAAPFAYWGETLR